MAETITIPSPSVFLRKSPPPSGETATSKPNAPKHARSNSAEAKKKAARKPGGPVNGAVDGSVIKPKQSKSRNGIPIPAEFSYHVA